MSLKVYLSGEIHTGYTLHAENIIHPLKEVDAAALAWATTTEQVVEILKYVTMT